MRIRSIIAATAALLVTAAVPAQAYNADAYAYGAGHMISAKQIPAPLKVKTGGYFSAGSDTGKSWICGQDSKSVYLKGGSYNFSINYSGKNDAPNSVRVTVDQYASATKAIAAWEALQKNIDTCAGEKSDTETYDDGTTDSWASLTTVGNVPKVTVTGVVSKFINTNYTDTTSGAYESNYSSDSYSVYTLVNDVIITTSFYSGSELNLTAAEKKAVNQVAFNAVGAWLG